VDNTTEILTPEDVAALLRVSESWVYEKARRRCRDPLPCFRIGRYIRFSRAAVMKWLESTATGNGAGKTKRRK